MKYVVGIGFLLRLSIHVFILAYLVFGPRGDGGAVMAKSNVPEQAVAMERVLSALVAAECEIPSILSIEKRGLYWVVGSSTSEMVNHRVHTKTQEVSVSECREASSVSELSARAKQSLAALEIAFTRGSNEFSLDDKAVEVDTGGQEWRVEFYEIDPDVRGGRIIYRIDPSTHQVLRTAILP